MQQVRSRDTVTPHLTRSRTHVCICSPEALTERDCANSQEHHGTEDVGTARTVLRGVAVVWGGGFWEESYYVGTAGDVSTDTIEQHIERTEHV